MRKPVLVATDFSEASTAALRRAAYEASERETTLIVLHCVELSGDGDQWGHFVERAGFQTSQIRTEALGRLDETFQEAVDGDLHPIHIDYKVEVGHPADSIQTLASRKHADVIVVGTSGRGAFERIMIGSVSEEIVRSASRPVMVVPDGAEVAPVDEILAPVDFSDCSRASLGEAARWAERCGARLVALHVVQSEGRVPPFSFGRAVESNDARRDRAGERLGEMVAEVVGGDADVEAIVEQGPPGEAIRAVAGEREPDLVVMGTHGRRGLERFMVGSTALDVLRRTRWPVVTVRA